MENRKLVRIKTWDRMKKEFGLDEAENINCKYGFTKDMEKALPKNRIIFLEEINNALFSKNELKGWSISNDMIEEELNPKDYPQYFI
jgi:hypothetical protein